ncbi:MAG TPA: hypothetical protein VG053_02345 [Solirubrobacteraceae bacterium]|nr:hypothetical protein [Solirubrobacteraceae bacterium]
MSDPSSAVKNLRERLAGAGEDHLGKALSDLLDNPLLTGTIGRAFDAREKAAQAQELAMGALNIPSAADIERLTRRLRSVSQRLEGIEDGVHRLDRALASHGVDRSSGIGQRLSKIEEQLGTLTRKLGGDPTATDGASPARSAARAPAPKAAARKASARKASAKKATSAKPAKAASTKERAAASNPRARRAAAKTKKA